MVSSIYFFFLAFGISFSLRDQHWFTSNNHSSITCVGEYPKGIKCHNFFFCQMLFSIWNEFTNWYWKEVDGSARFLPYAIACYQFGWFYENVNFSVLFIYGLYVCSHVYSNSAIYHITFSSLSRNLYIGSHAHR